MHYKAADQPAHSALRDWSLKLYRVPGACEAQAQVQTDLICGAANITSEPWLCA